jgi:hypothetical protein
LRPRTAGYTSFFNAIAGQLNARKVAAVFVECLCYEQFYLLRRISLAIPRGDFATGGGKQGFGEFDFQIIVVKGGWQNVLRLHPLIQIAVAGRRTVALV